MPTQEIETRVQEVYPLLVQVESLEITDSRSLEVATEMLSQVNKQTDRFKKEKEKVTKPLNAALKAERERWKPAETILTNAVNMLRSKMSMYQTKQKQVEDAAKSKIAARVGEGRGHISITTAARKMAEVESTDKQVSSDSGKVSFRTDYRVIVDNIREVPEEYLEVIEARIKADYKKDRKTIPGVTIKEVQVPINYR